MWFQHKQRESDAAWKVELFKQSWTPVYFAANMCTDIENSDQEHLSLNTEPVQFHVNIVAYQ